MGFFTELFEIFMGAMAEKSEELYRQSANSYDDSDVESVERYRNARELYNQASMYSDKTRRNVNAMNQYYGNKDYDRSRVEAKIENERQEKQAGDYENMVRNQYK